MRWFGLVCAAGALAACDGVFGLDFVPTAEPDAPAMPRPDAPLGVCGLVGTGCCASGSACTDGSQCLTVGAGSRCVLLAGSFEVPSATNGCATAPACEADNPFVNTPCSCPSGFAKQDLVIDDGCGTDTAPANSLATISTCAPAAAPASTDWGGWYLLADLVECIPGNPADHCMTPNPVTHACSCPGSTQAVNLRTFVPGTGCANGYLGGTLAMCLDTSVAVASIRGVFESDPDGACRVPLPGFGCRCPAGSVESKLRVQTDRVVNSTTLFFRSTITVCLAPP
ncbi:MAG: hypothetical protein JO257_07075 [Deltaproteobacteria bacterium]|nr:hypothetical protein [Deltaproteobacteria bacterium]